MVQGQDFTFEVLEWIEDKTTWIKLQESFPDLEYLEKVKYPGITLCPCDERGVWMKTIWSNRTKAVLRGSAAKRHNEEDEEKGE